MAQNDAKVNIELARSSAAIAKASKEDSAVMRSIALESKKDTTAMKTLSILGMVFLPGAFVAVSVICFLPSLLYILCFYFLERYWLIIERPFSQCRFSTGMLMVFRS